MKTLIRLAKAALGAVCLLPMTGWGQTNFVLVKTFGDPNQSGANPEAGLIEGSDGQLYGTAVVGGCGGGVVFALNRDGTGYRVLHVFQGPFDDGLYPTAPLLEASDGALYGLTFRTGGTVFKVNKDGSGFEVLHKFGGCPSRRERRGGLLEGSDGALYGTNPAENGCDEVFKLNKDGSGYSALYRFGGPPDGADPGGLIMGSDGALYGTTQAGGTSYLSLGTVFKLNQDGNGYAKLHDFTGSRADGSAPVGTLVEGSDGALYGTTRSGGNADAGTVFKLSKDGSDYTMLWSFTNNPGNGAGPLAALVQGSNGAMYGTTSAGGGAGQGTVFKLNTNGGDFLALHGFTNSPDDGANAYGPLLRWRDGSFYGTTYAGGSRGLGTIFKINEDGNGYATLFSFVTPPDSAGLSGPLVEGSDGRLYGVSVNGGAVDLGTVFGINTNGGGYRILHSFTNSPGDGANPYGSPVEGSDGALYGTTYVGGTDGVGLVFTVNKDGRGYSVLHSFTNALGDGANPNAALIEGSDGALYGTTLRGGIGSLGTVFRIGKDGSGYSVLHGFTNNPDGTVPSTPLLEGSDGVLYGTSGQGGSNDAGIVFKLHKDGNGYVILHSFNYSTDGGYPGSGLLEGSDGTLYGTTSAGGSGFGGTLFKINKNGSDFLVLQSFGSLGVVELLKGRDGTLYGTLYGNGGATVKVFKINQDGSGFTVLSTGALGPIVETRDGSLYGSTFFGGPTCKGTIFALFPEPRSWFTGWSATLNGIDSFSALAAAGVSFRLQSAADFAKPAWSDVSTNIANRSGALSFTNLPGAGPHLFYRLVAP